MDPGQEWGWYTQYHSTGENWFSFSQQMSTANNFLVRGRTLCLLPLLGAGLLSGLNLCRSWACYHSLCDLMFVRVCTDVPLSVLVRLEDAFPRSTPPPLALPVSLLDPWAERGGVWQTSYWAMSAPKSLTFCTPSSCESLCYTFPSMARASLVKVVQCSILWKNVVKKREERCKS